MSHHTVAHYPPCRVPLRRITFGDAVIVVHEGTVASIKRIEERWLAKGGNAAYRVRKADTGSYNCRKTTSGSSWSKHSWGCAVDVNWATNPYGSHLVTDMPRWFVQLWLDEGWGWGGNWSGNKDAMHFSKFPNEGGDGLLYVGEEPEEDDLPYTEAQLKEIFRETIREELDKKETGAFKPLYLWLTYKAKNGLYRQGIDDIVKATNADPTVAPTP